MMNNVKVSIVVPIYKVQEKYLRNCITSLQNQTLNEIEIILVDDGSPDDCGKICDEYSLADNRIKVIHKKNAGLSAARNTGYESASGDWLMFVDGDDWIDEKTCETLYRKGCTDELQVVICGTTKDYTHSSIPFTYYIKEKNYCGDECKWLQEQVLHFNGNIAAAYAKLYRMEFLQKYNITHNPILKQGAEGIEFNIRLFEYASKVAFVEKMFYHYTYNEESISASHNIQNHYLVIRCFEEIEKFIKKSKNKNTLYPWLENRLIYVVITTAISGYFNPSSNEKYKKRKEQYIKYLNNPLLQKALHSKNTDGLSFSRRIALLSIKSKQFWILQIIAILRKKQKEMS